MKNVIIAMLVIIVAAGGAYWWYTQHAARAPEAPAPAPVQTTPPPVQATTTQAAPRSSSEEVIGKSVGGRDIAAYHFGTGSKEILFVGGIHGGYEWNTVLLADDLINYLTQNPDAVPAGEKVTVIPDMNPDGLAKVTDNATSFTAADITASQSTQVAGRYNGNGVDLNRNFACDWQAKGVWRSTPVSGGSAAFSEPESQALEQYVQAHSISAAVVYYSAAGGVFASNFHGCVLPQTQTLVSTNGAASGYKQYESFDFYAITGDAVNWLAKQNIPAISVLLTDHSGAEWDKNQKGIEAVLQYYAQ